MGYESLGTYFLQEDNPICYALSYLLEVSMERFDLSHSWVLASIVSVLFVPSRHLLCNAIFHDDVLALLQPLLHICFSRFLNIKVTDVLAAVPQLLTYPLMGKRNVGDVANFSLILRRFFRLYAIMSPEDTTC